jgi:hypothetical protein
MSIVQLVAAAQTSSPQIPDSNPIGAGYFLIVLVAAVLALVVMIFIRTSVGRSSKNWGPEPAKIPRTPVSSERQSGVIDSEAEPRMNTRHEHIIGDRRQRQ